MKRIILFFLLITVGSMAAYSQQDQFFHVKQIDGHWWVIDPEGSPFHMRGFTHYGNGKYMPWNLEERYGSVEKWRQSVKDRHEKWGFTFLPPSIGPNAINPTEKVRQPAWGAEDFAELDYPFVAFLEVPKQYMGAGEDMPDVFSKKFQQQVDQRAKEMVVPLKDNKNLIGYHFAQNPPWNIEARQAHVWIEANTQPNSAGLKEWVKHMKRVYGTIDRWKDTYGVPIKEWSDILEMKEPLRGYISTDRLLKDKESFLRQICKKWYQVYHDTIRKYDKNHLLLGDRNTLQLLPSPAPWAYHIMADYIDVLSMNLVGPPDTQYGVLQETFRYWDGPILLADTGASIYEGEPGISHYQAEDIQEYEDVYAGLIQMSMEHPQIIGFGWGGYYETPMSESHRGSSGVVRVENDEPIMERVEIMKKWNQKMDEFMQNLQKQ